MPSDPDPHLDQLGEDLTLLSVKPDTGRIGTSQRIAFGLMGSELVRLAARGRIDIAADRVIVRDNAPTADAELDAALDSLARARRAPRAKAWVGHPRRGICDAYLARLAADGVLRAERARSLGFIPVTRWRIADAGRLAATRTRLDAIARSAGQVDSVQAAFGGLAHAIGLGTMLYPGWSHRDVRKRLEQIAKGQWSAAAVSAASSAAADAAMAASVEAANQAATQAAIDAATAAAVAASVQATQHAPSDGGGHH
jgi:Golgi phosphoprotein 3 (GPP34)